MRRCATAVVQLHLTGSDFGCTKLEELQSCAVALKDICALQKLAADDSMYFDSAWANPRSLKNQFSGVGNLRLS